MLQWQQAWGTSLAWAAAWSEPASGVDLVASPVAVSGSAGVSGALGVGRRKDIAASPVALTGSASVAGNIDKTLPAGGAAELQWQQAWSTSLAWREAWTVDIAGRANIEAQPIAMAGAAAVAGAFAAGGLAWEIEPPLILGAVSGSAAVAGDIGVVLPSGMFNLAASPLALASGLGVAGDVQAVVPAVGAFDIIASPLALSGAAVASGAVQIVVPVPFDVPASAALHGSIAVGGDIQIRRGFNVQPSRIQVSASLGVAGNIGNDTRPDMMYPMAGKRQPFPLAGKRQPFPLAGKRQF